MSVFLLRRSALLLVSLVGATFLAFVLLMAMPGEMRPPADREPEPGDSEPPSAAVLRRQLYLADRYGLDAPLMTQYVRWLGGLAPIKFGERPVVTPDGRVFRAPRPLLKQAQPHSEPVVTAEAPAPRTLAEAIDRVESTRIRHLAALDAITRATTGEPGGAVERRAALEKDLKSAQSESVAATEAMAKFVREHDPARAGLPLIPGAVWIGLPDLGDSIVLREPVATVMMRRLLPTVGLNLVALALVFGIALPCGVLSALRRGTAFDRFTSLLFFGLHALPAAWVASLLLGYVASSTGLGWFPVHGLGEPGPAGGDGVSFWPSRGSDGVWHPGRAIDLLHHMVLPVLCLAYADLAFISRYGRAAVMEQIDADHVRTARAKGVGPWAVLFRHVIRSGAVPFVALFAGSIPALLGGTIVVEKAFGIEGLGGLVVEAVVQKDRELLLGITTLFALVNGAALLLADLCYARLDPRIRLA
ncbi:MAG: ABC transporter permease [Phycisphaerales bacterium]